MTDSLVYLLVVCAACGHAAWNAIGFAMSDKYTGLLVMNVALGACGLLMFAMAPGLHLALAPYLAVSVILHCGYQLALLKAYTMGGFLQVYPISRGLVPVVVTAGAMIRTCG